MKSKSLLSLGMVFILWLSLLLVGCEPKDWENTKPDNSTQSNVVLPDNEVASVMKNFANELGAKESDIHEDTISRYNIAENDFEEYTEDPYYDFSGYTLSVSEVKDLPNMSKLFDGWHVFYLWDEIWWASIEYSKDNIACLYYQTLEQEIPYELMVWEFDDENEMEDLDKARADFYDTATYTVEISCGYLPEWVVQLKDFNFYAEWMEPFWRADIAWDSFNIFTPDGLKEEYIETLQPDWDNFNFKWYNSNWRLEKADCIDWWKWDTHEYKISFDVTESYYWDDGQKHIIWTTHYEWCADKEMPDFVPWEEWTLKNFIKKSWYQYTKDYDQDKVSYAVWNVIGKYVVVNFYYVDGYDYDSYQSILEKTDNGWTVLYEWEWYDISDEECERLNQHDNNLMDMFFLKTCPRG